MKETISEFKATYSLESESDSEFASILLQPTTMEGDPRSLKDLLFDTKKDNPYL